MITSDYEKVRRYEEFQKLKVDNERLRADLIVNAQLLARQCDLSREAETITLELLGFVKTVVESQGWDGNNPNEERWTTLYNTAKFLTERGNLWLK